MRKQLDELKRTAKNNAAQSDRGENTKQFLFNWWGKQGFLFFKKVKRPSLTWPCFCSENCFLRTESHFTVWYECGLNNNTIIFMP